MREHRSSSLALLLARPTGGWVAFPTLSLLGIIRASRTARSIRMHWAG